MLLKSLRDFSRDFVNGTSKRIFTFKEIGKNRLEANKLKKLVNHN